MLKDKLHPHLDYDYNCAVKEKNESTEGTVMPQIHHTGHYLIQWNLDLAHNMHQHGSRHLYAISIGH